MKVGIIDYGVGNIGSVARAIEELRATPLLVDRALDLHGAECIILPGVGNFSECMSILSREGWVSAIHDEVRGYKKPLLGICLGMQLLADSSSEGAKGERRASPGLGLIPGHVDRLAEQGCDLRVPHVGWNGIVKVGNRGFLFDGIPDGTDFYFVHSYVFVPTERESILATCTYGCEFPAAVGQGHVWGTQFHPEKSSRAGIQVLRNFLGPISKFP